MQLLRHQKLWQGSRVRAPSTRHHRQLIPRAAPARTAGAKIVIYCSDINQTSPSLLISLNSPFLYPPNSCVHSSSEKAKHRSELQPIPLRVTPVGIHTPTDMYSRCTHRNFLMTFPCSLGFWTLPLQLSQPHAQIWEHYLDNTFWFSLQIRAK